MLFQPSLMFVSKVLPSRVSSLPYLVLDKVKNVPARNALAYFAAVSCVGEKLFMSLTIEANVTSLFTALIYE
jgi:hypothetical protein